MKFIVQDPFSIKKVLIFGGFGLCRFQHKVGMNSFHMRMNVFSYGTNSFPWGMYSFRSKIPIVEKDQNRTDQSTELSRAYLSPFSDARPICSLTATFPLTIICNITLCNYVFFKPKQLLSAVIIFDFGADSI